MDVPGIAFGEASTALGQTDFFTSTGFVGQGHVDDYRLREWCGVELESIHSGIPSLVRAGRAFRTEVMRGDQLTGVISAARADWAAAQLSGRSSSIRRSGHPAASLRRRSTK